MKGSVSIQKKKHETIRHVYYYTIRMHTNMVILCQRLLVVTQTYILPVNYESKIDMQRNVGKIFCQNDRSFMVCIQASVMKHCNRWGQGCQKDQKRGDV